MEKLNTVGVIGENGLADSIGIISVLASACGLKVRRARLEEANELTGLILLSGPGEKANPHPSLTNLSYIHIIASNCHKPATAVQFGAGAPMPFRKRLVVTGSAEPEYPYCNPASEVIASVDGKPVWTAFRIEGVRQDICWSPYPWIKEGDCAFNHLNDSRFMNLLPLLEWFRWISNYQRWKQPPLRACFILDDPNLHAARYGFIAFDRLADEGKRYNYHTSFATIPLDSYYVNEAAARIFRKNAANLSFLVHGNNHTYRELAERQDVTRQLALMRQAMQRIRRLEQTTGLTISKIMAPPHGVCSAMSMNAMMDAGFEGVCVSHGSVWTGNPNADWTISLGAFPATMIDGFPVIPRFGLDSGQENNILLAAYLDQPIVLVGHHWDLAGGVDILSSAATFINSLGRVDWSNMTAIARSNYRYDVQGECMRIQAFSRAITVQTPQNIGKIHVEFPSMDGARHSIECISRGPNVQKLSLDEIDANGCFKVIPGSCSDITAIRKHDASQDAASLPRTPLRAFIRKALVEMRDRSMPYVPGIFSRR
jgi:hypothetical protein